MNAQATVHARALFAQERAEVDRRPLGIFGKSKWEKRGLATTQQGVVVQAGSALVPFWLQSAQKRFASDRARSCSYGRWTVECVWRVRMCAVQAKEQRTGVQVVSALVCCCVFAICDCFKR